MKHRNPQTLAGLVCLVLLMMPSLGWAQDDLDDEVVDDLDAPIDELDETYEEEVLEEEDVDDPRAADTEATVDQETSQAESNWRVGARFAFGYNHMRAPFDLEGEPTLLFGSAFSGVGFQAGATIKTQLSSIGAARIGLTADILYAYMNGKGYAQDAALTQRRTIELTSHGLRIPLLLEAEAARAEKVAWVVGVGPEMLVGLATSATVTDENLGVPIPELFTTPTLHAGIAAQVGAMILRDDKRIPLILRFTWDPAVPRSTRGRFEGYIDNDNPGRYQVGFDFHVHATVGVAWDL